MSIAPPPESLKRSVNCSVEYIIAAVHTTNNDENQNIEILLLVVVVLLLFTNWIHLEGLFKVLIRKPSTS